MILAVVDPGVLVSAFIGVSGSVPDRIVSAWRAGLVAGCWVILVGSCIDGRYR